jgi:hypothetical protein
MQLEDVRRSLKIMKGGQQIETLRRALNAAYSEVPEKVDEVFSAVLDQIADQQVAVTDALTLLMDTEALAETEQKIVAATSDAERAALRAARAFADAESDEANTVYAELSRMPANITDLVGRKQDLTKDFAHAAQLHERNDIAALDLLLAVATGYKRWCGDARTAIAGSHAIARSERIRNRLQIIGIVAALLLGIINIILNLLK